MKTHYIFIYVALVIGLTSCYEKEVDLIFSQEEQKVIITAWLTDGDEDQFVTVARSVDYTGPQPQEPVSEAVVMIIDGTIAYECVEIEAGKYQKPSDLTLKINSEYHLIVEIAEDRYEATAMLLPCPVITAVSASLFEDALDSLVVSFTFQDPPKEVNHYYAIDYKKGSPGGDTLNNGTIISDEFIDGELLIDITVPRDSDYYRSGDTAVVELFSVTEDAYLFLEAALRAENVDPLIALPPANVPSNINNGAFGYFMMSARQSSGIVID